MCPGTGHMQAIRNRASLRTLSQPICRIRGLTAHMRLKSPHQSPLYEGPVAQPKGGPLRLPRPFPLSAGPKAAYAFELAMVGIRDNSRFFAVTPCDMVLTGAISQCSKRVGRFLPMPATCSLRSRAVTRAVYYMSNLLMTVGLCMDTVIAWIKYSVPGLPCKVPLISKTMLRRSYDELWLL